MQNGSVMSGGAPILRPLLKKQGSTAGYALAVVPRDRVDYSVTKGGLRLWAVLFIFIVLVSSLYTVFSAKDAADVPFDTDGDGDYDNVDDDDDSIQRLEKERMERETPSRSPAERSHQKPDRAQLKRSKGTMTLDDGGDDDGEGEVEFEPPQPKRRSLRGRQVEEHLLSSLKEKHQKLIDEADLEEEEEEEVVEETIAEEEVEQQDEEEEEEEEREEEPPAKQDKKRRKRVEKKEKKRDKKVKEEEEEEVQEEEAAEEEEEAEDDDRDRAPPIVVKVIHKKGLNRSHTATQPKPRPAVASLVVIKVRRTKTQAPPPQTRIPIEEERKLEEEREREEAEEEERRRAREERRRNMNIKVKKTKGKEPGTIGTPQARTCPKEGCDQPKPKRPATKVKVIRTKGKPVESSETDDDDDDDEEDEHQVQPPSPEPSRISSQKLHSSYRKRLITNHYDNKLRDALDAADHLLDEHKLQEGLDTFESLLQSHPASPRIRWGRARAFDLLSEEKQSNQLLEQSIYAYESVISKESQEVPEELFRMVGERLVERCRFRGWMQKAADVQRQMIDAFPDDADLRNQFGVTWLMMGRNDDAKKTFYDVLKLNPNDGFALAHYGFILKTQDEDLEEAVKYLKKGIRTRDPGTQDGRFYFHLGDALQRLGRNSEAYRVYEEGAELGLFLSKYQRSLYNVPGLTAQAWWTHEQTGYDRFLKAIERQWMVIRQEAMQLVNTTAQLFKFEDEKLTSKGNWKQFTLFQRGKKLEENCKRAPKTCEIVSKFPAAVGCTRGQIKFSLMQGGTSVWPHCGPTNCRLRAHLGLVVPNEPKIRVGNDTKSWKVGKFIIFDDSFEHEVWHDGSQMRLILIVDFWHPELSEQQRASLSPI